MSASPTLAVLSSPDFPQVLAQAIDRAVTLAIRRIELSQNVPTCTHVDDGGYECGLEAIVQFLPDGDEARCRKHYREVRRG